MQTVLGAHACSRIKRPHANAVIFTPVKFLPFRPLIYDVRSRERLLLDIPRDGDISGRDSPLVNSVVYNASVYRVASRGQERPRARARNRPVLSQPRRVNFKRKRKEERNYVNCEFFYATRLISRRAPTIIARDVISEAQARARSARDRKRGARERSD